MFTSILKSPLSPLALRSTRTLLSRPLSTTHVLLSGNHPLSPEPTPSPSKPSTTQGHATDKNVQKDVQSQYVQQGLDARKEGEQSPAGAGENKPFDAARMDGGEVKGAEGKGPFKDQIGGQPGGNSDQGAGSMGETTEASGESTGAKVKKALGMKSSRKFHTSARSHAPGAPGGSGNSIPGARDPKETPGKLHGEQNPHLTHQSTGKDHAERKGNAADEPHLPSKSGSGGAPKGSKGFHTSARVGVEDAKYAGTKDGEAKKAGYNVPGEALPQGLDSAYSSQATPPPPTNLTPSSETKFSSSAQDPAHDVLRKKVLEGNMPEKNPQPSGEVGKQGLEEGWKNRKA